MSKDRVHLKVEESRGYSDEGRKRRDGGFELDNICRTNFVPLPPRFLFFFLSYKKEKGRAAKQE